MKNAIIYSLCLLFLLCVVSTGNALTVTTSNVSNSDMVNSLLGSNINLQGTPQGNIDDGSNGKLGGLFSNGINSGLGIDSGIIMTSGQASDADGPNTNGPETLGGFDSSDDDASTNQNLSGDSDLDNLAGFDTFDANVLEFDFTTSTGDLFFNYVFASEEYIDFVDSSFNDVFGFFVDGQNIGLVPGTSDPVTINTVNPNKNSAFYINNVNNTDGFPVANADIAYDGYTTVFTAQAQNLGAGQHHMKLAIADGSDGILDAGVFLEEGSFSGTNPDPIPEPTTWVLFGTGLIGLAGLGRKKFLKKA